MGLAAGNVEGLQKAGSGEQLSGYYHPRIESSDFFKGISNLILPSYRGDVFFPGSQFDEHIIVGLV